MAAPAATEQAWEAVIGLETHVQLGTDSKIFTAASTTFGDDPNTHIDPVVCGLPGTLPVLNQKVLEYAVKAAMALNLNIAEHSKFDRKQYFYPDLPKNYQISQYDEPIAEDGWIEVEVAEKGKETYLKTIGIERLHMEEDAGKLVHAGSDRLAGSTHSLVVTTGLAWRWLRSSVSPTCARVAKRRNMPRRSAGSCVISA